MEKTAKPAPASGPHITLDDRQDRLSAMHSPQDRQALVERLGERMAPPLARLGAAGLPIEVTAASVSRAILDFFTLYEGRAVRDNAGGSGFNDSLWLYLAVKILAPKRIIESGVHKGHSTWLLRQAVPEAEILCFDIDLSRLEYRDSLAKYHEHDWTETDLVSGQGIQDAGSRDLIFFDDHLSHARRLIEAAERGFTRLLFDDNFASYQLYATGGPPVPSLAMLDNIAEWAGRPLISRRKNKRYTWLLNEKEATQAKERLDWQMLFPEIADLTRYPLGSQLTYAQIKTIGTG